MTTKAERAKHLKKLWAGINELEEATMNMGVLTGHMDKAKSEVAAHNTRQKRVDEINKTYKAKVKIKAAFKALGFPE